MKKLEFIKRDLEDIVMMALRYALPRHTYALTEVIDFIKDNEYLITDRTKTVMLRDVQEQLDRYAVDCPDIAQIDKNTLISFKEYLTNKNIEVAVRYHDCVGINTFGERV